MEREQLVGLLNQQADRCKDLADRLSTYGTVNFTQSENQLARIATLPALQEAFEKGITTYLIYGEATQLIQGIKEAVHES
jgi:hypothetical protein